MKKSTNKPFDGRGKRQGVNELLKNRKVINFRINNIAEYIQFRQIIKDKGTTLNWAMEQLIKKYVSDFNKKNK